MRNHPTLTFWNLDHTEESLPDFRVSFYRRSTCLTTGHKNVLKNIPKLLRRNWAKRAVSKHLSTDEYRLSNFLRCSSFSLFHKPQDEDPCKEPRSPWPFEIFSAWVNRPLRRRKCCCGGLAFITLINDGFLRKMKIKKPTGCQPVWNCEQTSSCGKARSPFAVTVFSPPPARPVWKDIPHLLWPCSLASTLPTHVHVCSGQIACILLGCIFCFWQISHHHQQAGLGSLALQKDEVQQVVLPSQENRWINLHEGTVRSRHNFLAMLSPQTSKFLWYLRFLFLFLTTLLCFYRAFSGSDTLSLIILSRKRILETTCEQHHQQHKPGHHGPQRIPLQLVTQLKPQTDLVFLTKPKPDMKLAHVQAQPRTERNYFFHYKLRLVILGLFEMAINQVSSTVAVFKSPSRPHDLNFRTKNKKGRIWPVP